ncbi:hypothetical protein OEA41_008225 [Lepraria neglecta]|uniref:Uncharacterized protein n=1 Tax=Lepraria neglecta TaxID=209136 RepID=A0AAD9ZH18_9LECA|nr:hypothetical protein OEA41_008225 [Lepraria neglecta]
MSKRRITDDGVEYIGTPLASITEAQLAALQEARSALPLSLESLSPLLENILAAYGEVTRAATDLRGTTEAAIILGVDYKPNSMDFVLELKEDEQKAPEMNPHYAAVIEDLKTIEYVRSRTDESITRAILELVLVDRLNQLKDMDASRRLLLSAEVPVSMKYVDERSKPILLRGRADWALGYGTDKRNTGSLLIIVETKPAGSASVGMPQMLVYMAAIQDARQDQTNKTVFGMLSDGTNYTFACLDNNKRLLISRIFQWLFDRQTILRHIDRILLDAIQSSPHTTPVKLNNPNIYGYKRHLRGSWNFGEDSDDREEEGDEDDEEGDLVDVVERNGHIFLRSKRSA